jgi:hypothetical protein
VVSLSSLVSRQREKPGYPAATWQAAQPCHAEVLGWSDECLAEVRHEPRSRVGFDLEPVGGAIELTVTLDRRPAVL